jgi:AhpD family alkylhydroperoxidase
MAHVQPMDRAEIPELEAFFASAEAGMGFVPNSMLTMAHMRQLPAAFSVFAGTVFGADAKALVGALASAVPEQNAPEESLPRELIQLIAFSVSVSAGCRYCQAHTSHSGHRLGETEAKYAELLSYETSDLYTPAERAVVALALAAGQVPNAASAEHFEALRAHFNDRQIVQIVAVIALFGFLNRWNDTMATMLEAAPTEFAKDHLTGWDIGKHAGDA